MKIYTKILAASFLVLTSSALFADFPAARVGDSMSSGGVIIGPGEPTVLIGGFPAARVTDMTISPLINPGPVPCVGGPILPPGSPTVQIGSLPAARVTDLALTVCGTHVIILGEPTVLIGN